MKKKELTISIIIATIISIAMGFLATLLVRLGADEKELSTMPPAAIMYILSILESVIVGIICAVLLPLGKLGMAFARKCNANPPGMKFNLINSIPLAVGNSIIVSAVVCFINVAQAHSHIPKEEAPPLFPMFLGGWLKLLIPSIILSYVLAIILSPVVVKIVRGKDSGNL